MRVSLGQILILLIISFLLFGDFENTKKNAINSLKKINNFFNQKNRKKGT